LLQLSGSDYRDFRPSIQFASVLFRGYCVYDDERCNEILKWLNISFEEASCKKTNKKSKIFKDGGFMSLIGAGCNGLFRYPEFKFRPSQADLLHLDIMSDGVTIVGDGGSYSYNKGEEWLGYFSGIKSHNTIQFDNSESMPRLSRFLFGGWPKVKHYSFNNDNRSIIVSAKYIDHLGRSHERTVSVENRVWTINDQISGFSNYAILRWRLGKSEWSVKGNQVASKVVSINIHVGSGEIVEMKLVKGFESIYYNEVSDINVLEIKLNKPCIITTIITLAKEIN